MSRTIVIIVGIVVVVALAVGAFALFRTPDEASAPIEAVPLVVETAAPVAVATAAPEPTATTETQPTIEPTVEPTVAEVQPTQEPATPEPTATATATDVPPAEEPASTGGLVVFEIVPAESQARFVIDEVLRGAPKTVVGTTDQVSGQLAVDPADPSTAQVGTILINARTLATDSGGRDRALKNWILQTNQYEFVTFEPSGISGLPDSAAVGEPFTFQLAGDLTVRDTTVPVTFDVTVTPVSDTRLEGLASLTIPYRELNVSIPDSPSVDTVADDLTLELQFVATPVSGV